MFRDEPKHYPITLKKGGFEEFSSTVCELIKGGERVVSAFNQAGLSQYQYYQWRRWYREELDDGLTDTPLIRLFSMVEASEAFAEKTLVDKIISIAEDGDLDALKFVLERRYGWTKETKSNVQVESNQTGNLVLNLVPMIDDCKVLDEADEDELIDVDPK